MHQYVFPLTKIQDSRTVILLYGLLIINSCFEYLNVSSVIVTRASGKCSFRRYGIGPLGEKNYKIKLHWITMIYMTIHIIKMTNIFRYITNLPHGR